MTRQEEIIHVIQGLSLMDDDMFNACFANNIECTELLLHIILDRTDLKIKQVRTQEYLKDLHHRSIQLDAFATDTQGRKYNIEVQRLNQGADPRRARYHSSLIDADLSYAGEEFQDLPDTYVIFITQHDKLKGGLPLYTIDRVCHETQEPFHDGTHIIYVNASYQGDSPLGKLIADFHALEPERMNYPALQKQLYFFKKTPEGVRRMCVAVENLVEKLSKQDREEAIKQATAAARTEARIEALRETRIENATNLLKLGKLSVEEISLACNLTVDEVTALVAN
jgi:predicted transposase/invertase (TIGR01784 family)